jgi:DNA-binding ferritin-like protein
MNDNMALFLATLLHSSTNTHFAHWSTDSYAKHKALGRYYEDILELVDDLAETYMGCYEQIKSFPSTYNMPKDPVKYMEALNNFVSDARKDLPQESQIQNIIDEIAQLIDSTLYKLRFLK